MAAIPTDDAPCRLFFPRPGELSSDVLDALVGMINRVYFAAEGDLFGSHFERTNRVEVEALIEASQFLVLEATLQGDEEPTIHGCMYLKRTEAIDQESEEEAAAEEASMMFGMLAVSEASRSQGFGNRLLDRAEQHTRETGCSSMRLTLLSPLHEHHAHKKFLEAWYSRRGFTVLRTLEFHWHEPLAKECVYRCFGKAV